MKCKKCGSSNRRGVKFCEQCGMELKAVPTKKPVPTLCPSCGFKNRKGVKFCEECGADLKAPPPPAQEPAVHHLMEEQSTHPTAQQSAPPIVVEVRQEKKRHLNPLWLLILLLLLLTCCFGLLLTEQVEVPEFAAPYVEPYIEPYLEDMRESYRDIIDRFIPDGEGGQDGGGGEGKPPENECDRLIEDEQHCEALGGTPYIDYVKNHCICTEDDETWQDWCVREGGTWIEFRDIVDHDGLDLDGMVECTFYPQAAKKSCEELGGTFIISDPDKNGFKNAECREKDKAFFGLTGPSDTCCEIVDVSGVHYEGTPGVTRFLHFDVECDDKWPISPDECIPGETFIGEPQDIPWADVTCCAESDNRDIVHCKSEGSVQQKVSWTIVRMEYEECEWESPKFYSPPYYEGSSGEEEEAGCPPGCECSPGSPPYCPED